MPEADVIISFVFLEDCLTSQRSVPCRPVLQRAKDDRPQGCPVILQLLKMGYLVLETAAESLVLRFCPFHMVHLLPNHLVCIED